MDEITVIDEEGIKSKIHTIRGVQVMLDSDLADLYSVETKQLNKAVNRNLERFPESFRFQLTQEEFENLRFQFGTSKTHGGRRYLPFVFSEQGVSMLSAVLRSKTAISVSIKLMETFVAMRTFLNQNAGIFQRLENVEKQLLKHDENFSKIFNALESDLKPKQGIFYDGQIFDAYVFVSDLIRRAKKEIILIDNYIDESVLTLLSKRSQNVKATIYTKTITKELELDLKKHNAQYEAIEVKRFDRSHDRFLVIDEEIYHIGASLKDLGKRWFGFSRMDGNCLRILE